MLPPARCAATNASIDARPWNHTTSFALIYMPGFMNIDLQTNPTSSIGRHLRPALEQVCYLPLRALLHGTASLRE